MPNYIYVSLQGDDRVLIFTSNPVSGLLTAKGEVQVSGGPAPMAIGPQRRSVYVGRRGSKQISSFAVDQTTGGLTMSGTVDLETDPCYLSTDHKGRFVLAAYYEGARVTVHPVGTSGAVGQPPVVQRPTFRGAHCFQTDPTNHYAFVPHIAGRGPNLILQFKFDEATGQITPNNPDRVSPDEPVGPRHYCFHPRLHVLYFTNEQGCSVSAYNLNTANGTLKSFQTISTLPAGFQGQNTCAQIQITPDGKFLYAPNRGHDSIAGFSIDPASGRLTSLGHTPAERVPRVLSLDPQGKFLYSAGLESGKLAAYRVDQNTGKLDRIHTYDVGQRPMWVLATRLGEG
ncbi:MAG: lactonase family protein [SAR202 cluster bacterium]|nr:lactonase family protein [SAR202 cluster bacterium]